MALCCSMLMLLSAAIALLTARLYIPFILTLMALCCSMLMLIHSFSLQPSYCINVHTQWDVQPILVLGLQGVSMKAISLLKR